MLTVASSTDAGGNCLLLLELFSSLNETQGSYYSAEYIFPDFPEQNELFSLTNLFMRNTNAGFQSLAITLETRAAEQMKK